MTLGFPRSSLDIWGGLVCFIPEKVRSPTSRCFETTAPSGMDFLSKSVDWEGHSHPESIFPAKLLNE